MNEPQLPILNASHFADQLAQSISEQVRQKLKCEDVYGAQPKSNQAYPFIAAYYSQRLGVEYIFEAQSENEVKLDIRAYGTYLARTQSVNSFQGYFQQRLAHHLPEWRDYIGDLTWLTPKTQHAPFFTCSVILLKKKEFQTTEKSTSDSRCDLPHPDPLGTADYQLGNHLALA